MRNFSLSKLEVLPNELLVEIFEYFTARELYCIFYGLNRRFRSIVDSISDLSLTVSDHTFYELSGLDGRRVRKLSIDGATKIDLRLYPQTLALRWIRPVDAALRQLCSFDGFPCMKHLSILYTKPSGSIARLHQLIFSNGFPLIRTCRLSRIDAICSWTSSPNLRTLLVCGTNEPLMFQRILGACPNLSRLHLHLLGSVHSVSTMTNVHRNLKRLYLTSSWSLYYLENVLRMVPGLVLFNGKWLVREQPILYFQQLSDTFNRFLPHLNRFECDFLFTPVDSVRDMSATTLGKLHPCFTNRLQVTALSYRRVRIDTKNG
jgi:hypothetical protein